MIMSREKIIARALNIVAKSISDKETLRKVCRSSKLARESMTKIKRICKRPFNYKFNEEYTQCNYKTPQDLWNAVKEYYVIKYNLDGDKAFSRDKEWVEARNFYVYMAYEMTLGSQMAMLKPVNRNRCTLYHSIAAVNEIQNSEVRLLSAKKRFEELKSFILN